MFNNKQLDTFIANVMSNATTSPTKVICLDVEGNDFDLFKMTIEFSACDFYKWADVKELLNVDAFDFWVGGEYTNDRQYDNHSLMAKDTDGNVYTFCVGGVHVWQRKFVAEFERLGCEALIMKLEEDESLALAELLNQETQR